MNISQVEDIVPLTPQAAAILLMVASRPLYGYAIRQQAQKDLHFDISIGSIYPTLNRLKQMYLIESVGEQAGTASPNKRHMFKITKLGRDVLRLETDRQAAFVGIARHYNKAA